ncbi:MAG: dihydroorotase [Clostridia bacterium]|nr:dihydroorotase [Clostridia bacterium]
MSSILIKGGRLVDPKNNVDKVTDMLVKDGKVAKISESIAENADKVINAEGLVVMPGLIDLHVHFREPGYEKKETIATGSRAGAMGGFTTVCQMPNTDPVTDNAIMIEYALSPKRNAVINVLPIGAITKGQKSEELADIGQMAAAGACAISEDGKSVADPALMKNAMRYSKMFNLPVFDHCEEIRLAKGSMNAGERASMLGLKGIGDDSEEIIVSRDIILAKATGAKLHICHISTEGSVEQVKNAKEMGLPVTAEVTPHHFTLCDEDIVDYDSNFKMNPPLRSRKDLEIIRQAIKDNIIEVIATDHAPHHIDDKNCEFEKAANGITGLETSFALSYTELVDKGLITLSEMVAKMTSNPAEVLGIDKGQLSEGAAADIAIADIENTYKIDVSSMVSKAKNTPFGGREVKGKILYTICGGEVVVDNGKLMK